MSSEVPATELIRRIRDGQAQARDLLFIRYQSYLQVLARTQLGKQLRGKCEASDVVQMTLLEAHRDFASFQGEHECELLAWLRRILAHNLYNEARRLNAQQRDASREVSLDQVWANVERSSLALSKGIAATTLTPSQIASRREDSVRMATALAKLPEDYQTVLLLRIFEELPAKEVAQRMGRTAGAVRMLQMRALAALREVMSEDES